jgi:hypothetical protein
MSYGTYVRKVRDPALPLAKRTTALRSAVVLCQPVGWRLTLRFLDQAVQDMRGLSLPSSELSTCSTRAAGIGSPP